MRRVMPSNNEIIRPEIQALDTNAENTMLVNEVPIKKGSVARLTHCINFIESGDLNSAEVKIINAAVDECLESFCEMDWHLYFSFKQPTIQARYNTILENKKKANNEKA